MYEILTIPAVRVALVILGMAGFGAGIMVLGPSLRDDGRGAVAYVPAQVLGVGLQGAPDKAQAAADRDAVTASREEKRKEEKREELPAFDVVRVERDGDSVVAGRAEPGVMVELLRDGTMHDRTVADAFGLFAMTPPKLPWGDHKLTLRFTASDGRQGSSKDSVSVSIAQKREREAVVALVTPHRPAVLLSSPEKALGGGSERADEKVSAAKRADGLLDSTQSTGSSVAIETAEAGEGGKLHVGGRASSGATIRLYLNETYLASGSAGIDGRFAFSVAGGMTPGDYRIRLDHVDAMSGVVKSRAEVPFNLPGSLSGSSPSTRSSRVAARADTSAAPSRQLTADVDSVPKEDAGIGAKNDGGASGAKADKGGPGAKADLQDLAEKAVERDRAPGADDPGAPTKADDRSRTAGAGDPSRSADAVSVVVVPEVRTSTVSRGDTLWGISHRNYGHGTRYKMIYTANQSQIRNPHWIYPGQVFVLPTKTQ